MSELSVARKSVGIDIGSHSLKAVVASKKGPSVLISRFVEIPVSRSGPAEAEELAAAMEELCKHLKIGSALVVSCISTQQATVRNLEIPFSEEEKARQILKFQTEPYLAFPIEKVIVDFYNTESAPEGRMKVLLTAIHKDAIKEHLALLSRSQIDPEVVDVDFMALSNTVIRAEPGLREGAAVVFDVGASKTVACYLQEGKLLAVRCITLAGDDFTTAISKELGVSFEEAERIKVAGGISDDSTQGRAERARSAIGSVLKRFAAELDRTMHYFASQVRAGTFNKVILCGGAASLPGLDGFLAERLSAEVSVISPSEALKNRSGQQLPLPRFATAAGLALRGLGESLCLQNFRQEEYAYSRPFRRLRKRLALSGALVFGVAAVLIFNLFASLDRYRAEQLDLEFRIRTKRRTIFPNKSPTDIAQMRELLEEEANKLTPFRELCRNISLLEVFDDLSTRIPKDMNVEVSRFQYTKSNLPQLSGTKRRRTLRPKGPSWGGTLIFNGTVSSNPQDVVKLERILNESPCFGEVVNKGGTSQSKGGRINFQFTLKLKEPRT